MNNDWVVKGKMKREMWPITRRKWRIKGDGGQEAGKLERKNTMHRWRKGPKVDKGRDGRSME